MITRLHIANFQSINHLDVECGPITVFFGETDVGKSAIVRAMYALAFNDYPKGHVRDGAQHSKIGVTVDDEGGSMVAAVKGAGINYYALDLSGQTLEFDRVGTNVPEEVEAILEWRMLEVDDGTKFTPNFGRQFDAPFLITETPSRKAKLLGSLTNIATLYAAMKEALSRERADKANITTWGGIHEKVLEEIADQEQIVDAAIVREEGMAERVAVLRTLNEELGSLREALASVEVAKAQVDQSQRRVEERKAQVIDLAGVSEMMNEWRNLRRRVLTIESMVEAVSGHHERVRLAEKALVSTRSTLDEFRVEHPMCPMCGKDWH